MWWLVGIEKLCKAPPERKLKIPWCYLACRQGGIWGVGVYPCGNGVAMIFT